jgi:hypothetical protein
MAVSATGKGRRLNVAARAENRASREDRDGGIRDYATPTT